MSDNNIKRHSIPTKNGNCLEFFYNPENDLVVVDLIHRNEFGGKELFRMTIDETKLLEHVKRKRYGPNSICTG